MIEIMRYMARRPNGVARLDHNDLYVELARRGVLDPMVHLIKFDEGGAMAASHSAVVTIMSCIGDLDELGLIRRYDPSAKRSSGNARHYRVTTDGQATLEHWDDPTSEGVWALR